MITIGKKIATLGGGLTKYYNAVGTSSGGEYYFAVAAYTKDEASVGEKISHPAHGRGV